jgi:kumamolisin
MAKIPLAGSERSLPQGATIVGKADPDERFEISVQVRRRNAAKLRHIVGEITRGTWDKSSLSREEFSREFAASPDDIAAVKHFATVYGLSAVADYPARCTIRLAGTVAQFNAAFDVDLLHCTFPGGTFRGRQGTIKVPESLSGIVNGVFGLDDRPAARPQFRRRAAAPAADTSFTPPQVAQLYDFPAGAGAGQCVGIVELGGGEVAADLATYFAGIGISPAPTVTAVSVDDAENQPVGDPDSADGEVMLDIEVVGAIAPQAAVAVYFAPNTTAGFLDAITTAIHDTTNKPSVISISWGGPESTWTQQDFTEFDSAFQAAVAMGITICVASGDNGSSDGVDDGADHVDFPASSPHVLACGGTSIQVSGTAIAEETVWNDGAEGGAGGGGVSNFFALPTWQEGLQTMSTGGGTAPLTMRGVPDVSGDADPETGYQVRVDGTDTVVGGTSAVAPLWAALIARINAATGTPAGFVNPALYGAPAAFNDITKGDNGDFQAGPGWDACTGLGSPDGTAIARLFTAA